MSDFVSRRRPLQRRGGAATVWPWGLKGLKKENALTF